VRESASLQRTKWDERTNPTLSAIDIVLPVTAVKPEHVKYASGMFFYASILFIVKISCFYCIHWSIMLIININACETQSK
jgi:hypothetical protein